MQKIQKRHYSGVAIGGTVQYSIKLLQYNVHVKQVDEAAYFYVVLKQIDFALVTRLVQLRT